MTHSNKPHIHLTKKQNAAKTHWTISGTTIILVEAGTNIANTVATGSSGAQEHNFEIDIVNDLNVLLPCYKTIILNSFSLSDNDLQNHSTKIKSKLNGADAGNTTIRTVDAESIGN